MQKPWFRLPGLVLLHLLVVFAASAQSGDPQARDREWKSYKLPPVEFARYVDPTRVVMFRVPKDWQQAGFRRFKGPQGSELALVIEKIPDGAPLASLTNGVLQSLRGLPGADETFTLRHTEISTLEAREVMFSLVDPAGLMTRRLLWFTVSGPNAVSFVLIVPEASAAEVEPYFKAIVESAFVFESDAHGKIFEDLRAKAIKTDQPSRITELRELTTTIAGFDSEARSKAIARLSLLFNSAPDSVVDLLIDRRSLVRGSAVEALGRSSNKTLDGFLLLALADPSADVAVRAARTLAGRDDVVKLLRDDSAGWSGLQVEKVMRAIPMLDDRARAQIIRELAGDPKPRISIPRLAPPPPPSAGSAKRPAREQPSPKIKTKPPMILGGVPGGLPGGVPRGLPGRDFTEEAAAAAMLPDFDAITSVLPPNRLLDSTTVTARMAMTFALESRGKLPVASLLKLLADEDAEVGHLAALNLAVSANSADIARIEDFAKGLVTISGSTPGEGSTRRSLKEELGVTVKKIRWRERFLSATAESREAIVKETFEDSELAGFAFAYAGDAFEPAGPKKARPLPERATALDGSRGAGLSVSSLGANALPERVTLYAAIPDAQALVDKLARSFSSIQLESARNQANLLLMLKGIEAYLSKMFDAPPNAAILESSGVKPNSALVAATWTASGAPRGQKAAERKAVIARVADRDRFEHLIATYQKQIGRFDRIPEFISLGARLLPMLPALLPLGASAMTGSSSPRSDTPAYVVMGYSTCGGYPLTVIERRKMEWMTFSREPIYIAYVGDAAIMAPDLLSLQDCLRRLESSGPTLASNDEFKRIAAAGGDVIYMSDPVAAFNARSDERLALTERGGLRITNGGWESSFDVGLSEREWLKPEPFRPMNLKAPAALLPRTTVAYLVAKLDFATAWRRLG
ncbi:MAG TPA: hypothetical protein VFV34_08825, partial [Blastocatellia bacterium]|nr:hypothetical protein [Blastocatellia bacterium]